MGIKKYLSEATRRLLSEGEYNQPDYIAWVVFTNKEGNAKIESGWEYKEDAQDQLDQWEGKEGFRVVGKGGLRKLGLDPNEDANWGNPLKEEDEPETDEMDIDTEEMPSEPQEEDIVISPCGNLGSKYCVGIVNGESLGEFGDEEEALEAVKAWKEENQFFPTVWMMSDHGNAYPIDDEGNEIKEACACKAKRINEDDLAEDPVEAYLQTAQWSSNPDDVEDWDSLEFAEETKERAKADMEAFIAKAGDLLNGLDMAQVAHDFWLTRNGHGAGFWDGDYEEDIGQKLTDLSKEFGEVDLYQGDDGLLYMQGGKIGEATQSDEFLDKKIAVASKMPPKLRKKEEVRDYLKKKNEQMTESVGQMFQNETNKANRYL